MPLSRSLNATYEVRPREDHRGVTLISDALPFRSVIVLRSWPRDRARYRVDSADNLFLFKIAIPPEKPYVCPSPARTVSTPGFLSRTGTASKKALRLGDSGMARSTPTDHPSAASLR